MAETQLQSLGQNCRTDGNAVLTTKQHLSYAGIQCTGLLSLSHRGARKILEILHVASPESVSLQTRAPIIQWWKKKQKMPLLLIPGDPKSIRNSLSEVQDHDLNYIISDIYKFKKKKKKKNLYV